MPSTDPPSFTGAELSAYRFDGRALSVIDQRRLPFHLTWIDLPDVDTTLDAIATLAVRGAPLLGVVGAYALALEARRLVRLDLAPFREAVHETAERLIAIRPTAVNLAWGVRRVEAACLESETGRDGAFVAMREARAVADEDRASCRTMAEAGCALFDRPGMRVLTHCNSGFLATGGIGTAVGVIHEAHRRGLRPFVWVDETRPLLQGARLTAWELSRAGIPFRVICDNMAASVMARGEVDLVLTGADRIACNGDAANKIGTYGVALAAAAHGIPFHIAAPVSTFDPATATGAEIRIEERSGDEVRSFGGQPVIPGEFAVFNPAFDVTPARLIRSFVTEHGLVLPDELVGQKWLDVAFRDIPKG